MHDIIDYFRISDVKALPCRKDGAIRWMEHAHPIQGFHHGRDEALQRERVPLRRLTHVWSDTEGAGYRHSPMAYFQLSHTNSAMPESWIQVWLLSGWLKERTCACSHGPGSSSSRKDCSAIPEEAGGCPRHQHTLKVPRIRTQHSKVCTCLLIDRHSLLQGKDAVPFLEKLVVGDIQSIKNGSGSLSVFTNEKGGIIDDTVVTKVTN